MKKIHSKALSLKGEEWDKQKENSRLGETYKLPLDMHTSQIQLGFSSYLKADLLEALFTGSTHEFKISTWHSFSNVHKYGLQVECFPNKKEGTHFSKKDSKTLPSFLCTSIYNPALAYKLLAGQAFGK